MRRKKVKVMVAPPIQKPKTILVRPNYTALAGMCEVKFNNSKAKGPKLLDCFLGMSVRSRSLTANVAQCESARLGWRWRC